MNLFWTLVVAVSMVLGGCMYVSESAERESTLNVTAIDVGQGLAVLLEWDGRYAMYDFGPDSVGVVDSLVARGVDTLDWVVLSHFHRDHIGGFMELPGRGVFVRRLYVGADTSCGFFCDSVLRVARSMGSLIDTLLRGESVSFGEGVNGLTVGGNVVAGAECALDECPRFDVLWPTRYTRVGENRASMVLLGRLGVGKLLLTGDLDSVGERQLLEMNPTLSAELLQVGHHGSAGSNTLEFLSRVSPEYAFVSVGAGNRYGHPVPSVVRKLNLVLGDSARLYRTDLQGSIRFELSPSMGVFVP
ncbi:ComEC/Rec2 family competence protein [Fibrobacter sp. UWB11]|uniref:ComEC/Rec2 family competence protein n=1 Tax=Fibrobacter sp. UWB11 TaxID=1896202 RepID=UPI000926363B|nr:MBL fold metallo-hydrolase [Fibrobacter sp. UWB11]SIO40791.1 competence protein ComEC [Fibrobacter sp. UWB11]